MRSGLDQLPRSEIGNANPSFVFRPSRFVERRTNERRTTNGERRTPNAERRTPNAERRTSNVERRTLSVRGVPL
jgi:hypothetical protein